MAGLYGGAVSQQGVDLDDFVVDLYGEVEVDRGVVAEVADILAQAVNEAVLDVLDDNQEGIAHLTDDEAEAVAKGVLLTVALQAAEEVHSQLDGKLGSMAASTAGEALGRPAEPL